MFRILLLSLSICFVAVAEDIDKQQQAALQAQLDGTDRHACLSACEQLSHFVGPRMRIFIEQLLSHERQLVRRAAVQGLQKQSYPNFDTYLDILFKRDDPLLRSAILKVYCERHPQQILSIAQRCLHRHSTEALRIAVAEVCALHPQSDLSKRQMKQRNEVYGELLLDESPHVQLAMLKTLEAMDDLDASLRRALQLVVFRTPYEETAMHVGRILAEHVSADDIEDFRKSLRSARGQSCVNGVLAGLQMNILGFSQDLLRLVRHKDPDVRAVVLETFGAYDWKRDQLEADVEEKSRKKTLTYLMASLKDKSDMVRICAAVSLARQAYVDVVPVLIKDLKKEESGVYQFLLEQLTGQQYDDPRDWKRWLAKQGDDLRLQAFSEDQREAHYFYNIKDESRHVAYVIDRSGSMSDDGRLYQVKCELFKSIMHLDPESRFNVVTFGNTAEVWQRSSLRASWRNRMRWFAHGRGVPADGGTNMMDALRMALLIPNVESIYFLTDGMPTVGVTNPQVILDQVSELNFDKLQVSRIHALSFDLPQARDFLTAMSQQNRGSYTLVGAQ